MKRIALYIFLLISCSSPDGGNPVYDSLDTDLEVSCLELSRNPTLLSESPGSEQCLLPKLLTLGSVSFSIDSVLFIRDITIRAENQWKASTGAVCIDGCSLSQYAETNPQLSDYFPRGTLKYQSARPCFRNDRNELICTSGPNDLTPLGWSYLIFDLVSDVYHQGISITDETSIVEEAVIDHYIDD
ncbi:MAG: hypothetical protein HRU19_06725 [Pseudobacteriovorax sp.]|nr:hypothetical protein [Pseudobacteriovorax sp.]